MREGILRHMSHLSVILTKRKMENSDCEIISFDSALGKHLSVFRNLICLALLKKPDISGTVSYERNYDGKLLTTVVVCPLKRIVYDQME